MRDRSWEERLPKILEALTLEEITFLNAAESLALGTSELSTEDIAAWFATLPPEGQDDLWTICAIWGNREDQLGTGYPSGCPGPSSYLRAIWLTWGCGGLHPVA